MKKELVTLFALVSIGLGTQESDCVSDTRFFNEKNVAVCEVDGGHFIAFDRHGNQMELQNLQNINRVFWSEHEHKIAYYQIRPNFYDVYYVDIPQGSESLESFYVSGIYGST